MEEPSYCFIYSARRVYASDIDRAWTNGGACSIVAVRSFGEHMIACFPSRSCDGGHTGPVLVSVGCTPAPVSRAMAMRVHSSCHDASNAEHQGAGAGVK